MVQPRDPVKFQQIIEGGESENVEFKLGVPPEHVIAAHLSAFANASGGMLFLGVNEKGEPVGLDEADLKRALTRLRRVSASLLPSPAEVGTFELSGKVLAYAVVLPLPEHLRPVVTSTGQVYQRRASTSKLLSAQEVGELLDPPQQEVVSAGLLRVFVAMSFRNEQEPALIDYFAAIKRAADASGLPLDLKRIDLVDGDYEISQQIMDEIDRSQIVIADFTLSPANVYFELGYSRGRGDKQIIQTARKDTALEFDVRNWRTEFYRNATELEEKILPALRSAYGRATGQD
jgi:hypothetical protein